jgi:hypothetical protein
MGSQSALQKEQIHPRQIGVYDLHNQLEKLRSENEELKVLLERLLELISEANPVLWVYQAPSFKRALDGASDWEVRAREILRTLETDDL